MSEFPTDFDVNAAYDHLRTDPALAAVLARGGEPPWPPPSRGEPFAALIRSVNGQQLSVRAAASIEARLREVAPNLAPQELAALSPEELRARGLSWAKVRTVRALAESVRVGLLDFSALERADDESVIAALTSIPGVGRWTAEMFLIFALGRPDVFSWGDAALRRAVRNLYGENAGPEVSLPWAPYRSLASRLLWRSLAP